MQIIKEVFEKTFKIFLKNSKKYLRERDVINTRFFVESIRNANKKQLGSMSKTSCRSSIVKKIWLDS